MSYICFCWQKQNQNLKSAVKLHYLRVWKRMWKLLKRISFFASLPLFFSPFFSLNRFMSRQATCVLFSPIRQSWQCKDLIIWKVWKVKVNENAAIGLLYKYVCKWEVRIKDVIKCHQLQLDLLCADAFSWNVSQILTQRRRWKYSPCLQFILEQTLWALPLNPPCRLPSAQPSLCDFSPFLAASGPWPATAQGHLALAQKWLYHRRAPYLASRSST